MSKKTKYTCLFCGANVRITESKINHGKNKAKGVRNPGILHEDENKMFWYCSVCPKDDHCLADKIPLWLEEVS